MNYLFQILIFFHFSKVHTMPLCYYESPILEPFLLKKSNEDFSPLRKRWSENSLQHSFSFVSPDRGCAHPERGEWRPQVPSRGTTLGVSASSRHVFEPCLCAPVLISIYCMQLERWVLRYRKAYKRLFFRSGNTKKYFHLN